MRVSGRAATLDRGRGAGALQLAASLVPAGDAMLIALIAA